MAEVLTITTSNSIIEISSSEVSKVVALKTRTTLSSNLTTPSKTHKEDINQERIIIKELIVEQMHRTSHHNLWAEWLLKCSLRRLWWCPICKISNRWTPTRLRDSLCKWFRSTDMISWKLNNLVVTSKTWAAVAMLMATNKDKDEDSTPKIKTNNSLQIRIWWTRTTQWWECLLLQIWAWTNNNKSASINLSNNKPDLTAKMHH